MMRRIAKATTAATLLALGLTGCSDTATTSTAGPVADKVTEGKSKAGREVPSGTGVMPKEPGR